MVGYGIVFMVLFDIVWYGIELYGIVWYYMIVHHIIWYCMVYAMVSNVYCMVCTPRYNYCMVLYPWGIGIVHGIVCLYCIILNNDSYDPVWYCIIWGYSMLYYMALWVVTHPQK